MAKSQQQVDIAITARDEASSIFRSVGNAAREFNMEARRNGDQALERILKGGGALGLLTFAMEAAGKAADGYREALREVDQGHETLGEGALQAAQKTLEAIPLFGNVSKAAQHVAGGIDDTIAHIARFFGASDKTFQELRSRFSIEEEGEANAKAAEAAIEVVSKARDRATLAGLDGIAKEREAARQAYEQEKKQTDEKAKKAYENVGDDKRPALNRAFNQARELEKQEYDAKLAELDKKDKRDRESEQTAHEARLRDIMGASQEADLESQGKHLEAKLAQLQRENDKALAEIDRRAEEERRRHPQDGNRINADAEAERLARSQALEAQRHAAYQDEAKRKEQEANTRAEHRAQLDRDLSSAHLAALQEEAKLGNSIAGEAARKLALDMQFQEHKEKLLKMLREEKDLNASQIADINKQIAESAKARDDAIAHPKVEIVENRKADLEESSRLQGIKDNAENPLIKIAQEHRDEATKQTDLLNTIVLNTTPSTDTDTPPSIFGN